jgi:hypothetical protein
VHQEPTAGGVLTTTNQGVVIADNQNCSRRFPGGRHARGLHSAGKKSRTLTVSVSRRERIPERIVHAHGSGAHGFFAVTQSLRVQGGRVSIACWRKARRFFRLLPVRATRRAICVVSLPSSAPDKAISIWSATVCTGVTIHTSPGRRPQSLSSRSAMRAGAGHGRPALEPDPLSHRQCRLAGISHFCRRHL